jgi:hypothetical protein
MRGVPAGFAVAAVIDDQHPLPMWRGCRVAQQQLDAPLVELLVVPGRLGEKPLQPLHGLVLGTDDRLGARQRGQRLVAVARQQQALQVGAEAAALREPGQQGIEPGGVALQRAGGGGAGMALGHRDHLSCETPRLSLLPHRPP